MTSENPHGFSWQQTMLRIRDPAVTIPFYENNFGFRLIHKYDFPQWQFALYFMAILPEGEPTYEPGTPESETYLWTMRHVCLELTHNYGSENDPDFKVNNGNEEPHRGFGHIAVATTDVYAACDKLDAAGVKFHKKPDEGRMKGLAFALDPDGYWIEVISRAPGVTSAPFTFAQTMLRIKDPKPSLEFYCGQLGMSVLREAHFAEAKFSLYFLAHLTPEEKEQVPADISSSEAAEFIRHRFGPVIELTHNHGTENDESFSYHNGNDTDAGQLRGFGHTGFLVNDLEAACASLEAAGVNFKKRPQDGNMRGLAFAYDPDGYWVEIIQRDGLKML